MKRVLKVEKKIFNGSEKFNKIEKELSKFFLYGGSHTTFLPHKIKQPAIFFFSKNELSCLICPFRDETSETCINLTCHCFSSTAFDFSDNTEGCHKLYILHAQKVYIGYYCKKYRVFSLSDFTHLERDARAFMKFVFPSLKEIFSISPLPPQKNKEIYHAEITLGCDPEFEELETPFSYEPKIPSISGKNTDAGGIGLDGAGRQVELRPKPCKTPAEVVDRVKELIKEVRRPLSVKGDKYALGGHIHFGGIPQDIYLKDVIKILDLFLGVYLLPLSGKARGSYKKLSSVELKDWGFEYRSLPSAFFINPEVAKVVFKIAKNVVEELLRNIRLSIEVSDDDKIPTKQEYLRIAKLTEEEYNLFLRFISEYPSYSGEPINYNWGGGLQEKSYIVFSCLDTFSETFKKICEEKLSEVKPLRRIRIFGLNQERGEKVVAGFHFKDYKEVSVGAEGYGFPYWIRVSENREVIEEIVNALKNHLEKEEKCV